MNVQIDETDGFVLVEVRTSAGPASAKLDVYEAYNSYLDLSAQVPEATDGARALAVGRAWCDWLAGAGLPGLSHMAAFKVFDALAAHVAACKKKDTSSGSAG